MIRVMKLLSLLYMTMLLLQVVRVRAFVGRRVFFWPSTSASLATTTTVVPKCRPPPVQWRHLSASCRAASTTTATTPQDRQDQQDRQGRQRLDESSHVIRVVLKRNQQSKAFRNGNQLVFTRAIQRFERGGGGKAPSPPRLAELVQVVVPAAAAAPPPPPSRDDDDDKTKINNNNPKKKNHREPDTIPLGWGVYNPDSLYKVRVLCHRFLQPRLYEDVGRSPDATAALRRVLRHHLGRAQSTRRALGLPTATATTTRSSGGGGGVGAFATDTYRLVNGEGDQLSGLAVDVIGHHVVVEDDDRDGTTTTAAAAVAVVMSSAAWCQVHRSVILECLAERLPPDTRIVWKTTPSRLQQDGYDTTTSSSAAAASPPSSPNNSNNSDDDQERVEWKEDDMVISTENGIKYQTYPFADGQKTGVYCDQRENRRNIAQLCRGKRVLDLCCYHGGFSLNAVVNGGAASCTGVDSSQDAIDACLANAKLNDCLDRVNFVRSDVTTFLQESAAQQDVPYYDVIVLDPPKLAPNAAGLDKAKRKYHAFNRDAIKLVDPQHGGLLLTCTCSAAMTQKDGGQYFLNTVQGAAQATGRHLSLLRVSGAAACHTQSPVSWPAGAYLTAALFYVHPSSSSSVE